MCWGDPQADAWAVLNRGGKEGTADHRAQAVAALGTITSDPQAAGITRNALQDKSVRVRAAAAGALGEMDCFDCIPYLRQALKDEPEVAFAAAHALWMLGDMEGRPIFQELLTGKIKNSPGLMEGAMRDAGREMRSPRSLAMIAVDQVSGTFLGPAAMGLWVAERAMKDTGAQGRMLATSYLAKDPDPYTLTLLEWSLKDSNWGVRAAAAQALGRRGDASAIPSLMPLLHDAHAAVQYMAAAAIVRLSNPPPKPAS